MILENIKPNELKQSAKILIIGNDLFYLKLMRFFLRKNGYKVQCFINLDKVLKYIDLTRFDLIISEVYLKKYNIDHLIDYLNKHNINKKLIIISQFLKDDDLIKYFSHADDYMKKPINFPELKIRIDKQLLKRKS